MKQLLLAIIILLGAMFSAHAATYNYEPHRVKLTGKLISAEGETPDGAPLNFPALQLIQPITVEGDQETPTEKGVLLLHMVLNERLMKIFKTLKNQPVVVEGTLFHSDNGNHQTNVLITPNSIFKQK